MEESPFDEDLAEPAHYTSEEIETPEDTLHSQVEEFELPADPVSDKGYAFLQSAGIKSASSGEKDDLKLISGVGPFIEQKLNKIGIYTFEQIASLSIEQTEMITEAIEFFPGRIQRDDWVGQAQRLM